MCVIKLNSTSNLPRGELKIKDFTFDILFNNASSEKKKYNQKTE